MPRFRKLFVFLLIALPAIYYLLSTDLYATPCYGTKMPRKREFFGGFQSYSIFKRYLEEDYGTVKSQQEFFILSFGVFDWFSIDLKGGAGDIRQRSSAGEKVDYSTSFSGGYGLRLRVFEREKVKAVFGFQHISVHPHSTDVSGVRNRAILDDWQTSLLVSYDFEKFTPYLGTRWSRVDYIHKVGEDRKRRMSDSGESFGLVAGVDIPVTEKIWLNLEGSAFDSEALAASLNFKF